MKMKQKIAYVIIFCILTSQLIPAQVQAAGRKLLEIPNRTVELLIGETYTPPDTIEVQFADYSIKQVSVKWDVKSYKSAKETTKQIYGTMSGISDKVIYTIEVKKPERVEAYLLLKQNEYTYNLPEEAYVTFKNSYVSWTRNVKWDKTTFKPSKPGKYTVNGTVAGTNIKAECVIEVQSKYVLREDFNSMSFTGNDSQTYINSVDFFRNPLISITNMPVRYDENLTFEQHSQNIAEIGRQLQLSYNTYYNSFSENGEIFGILKPEKDADYFNGRFFGSYAMIINNWRAFLDGAPFNEYVHYMLEVFKYFAGDEAGENLCEMLDDFYYNKYMEPEKFNFNITKKEIMNENNYLNGGDISSLYELRHKSGAVIEWIQFPQQDRFFIIFTKHGGTETDPDWKLVKSTDYTDNTTIHHVDKKDVLSSGGKTFDEQILLNKAGISLNDPPITYHSNNTLKQHLTNLSKLFELYGVTLDTKSGLTDFLNKDTKFFSPGRGIGGITTAGKNNFDGQYNGKITIYTQYWRRYYDCSLMENLRLNLTLEVYKYFLGKNAGEDLWSLMDYVYTTGKVPKSKFNYTIKQIGTSKSYIGNPDYTLYELVYKDGTKLHWLDAPEFQTDFDLVILKRGSGK